MAALRTRQAPALLGAVAAALVALPPPAIGLQGRPSDSVDGRGVLGRMHAAYAGRWYQSLAFVQHTTFIRPDGTRDTVTWYESLKGPDLLRIDFGAPTAGRGGIFTAESSFVFRDGKLFRSGAEGNPFLPVLMGVYLQPVEQTVRGLAHHGIDVAKMHRAVWEGRPAFVVGAANAADSVMPQFWVDAERLVVVRMRVPPAPGAPPMDIRIDDYVPVGGGWLGTRIAISLNGAPRQLEEYTEWSTQAPIADALFDRQQWVTASHWAMGERTGSIWTGRSQSRQ